MYMQPFKKTYWFYWTGGKGKETLIIIIMNSVMLVIINSFNRFINHSQNGEKQ